MPNLNLPSQAATLVLMLMLLAVTCSAQPTQKKEITKRLCEDIFDNHEDKSSSLGHVPFGEIWSKYLPPKVFCPDLMSRKNAIDQVTKEGCDVNWREGKIDKNDPKFLKAGNHSKQAMGPAVLGFDRDLDTFCKAETTSDPDASCTNHNRLYLKQWTLCKNMKWILCAGMGLLPGQNEGDGEIIMVTPVSAMDASRMATPADLSPEAPPLTDDDFMDYEAEEHRVPEAFGVTIHEVCTLNRMCKNGEDVFSVLLGGTFVCKSPSIPEDLLLDASTQKQAPPADDDENILPKFSSEGSRGLRGNGVVNTLLHVDQILEKEVDILDAEAGKA